VQHTQAIAAAQQYRRRRQWQTARIACHWLKSRERESCHELQYRKRHQDVFTVLKIHTHRDGSERFSWIRVEKSTRPTSKHPKTKQHIANYTYTTNDGIREQLGRFLSEREQLRNVRLAFTSHAPFVYHSPQEATIFTDA
jgi:hypothetical protein